MDSLDLRSLSGALGRVRRYCRDEDDKAALRAAEVVLEKLAALSVLAPASKSN